MDAPLHITTTTPMFEPSCVGMAVGLVQSGSPQVFESAGVGGCGSMSSPTYMCVRGPKTGWGRAGFILHPWVLSGPKSVEKQPSKLIKKWHTTLAHDFARLIFLFGPLKPSGSWVLQWVYLIFVSGFDSHRLRGYILTQYGV